MRVVRILPALACLLVWTAGAEAQEITLGVKGGLNASKLAASDADDPEFGLDSQTGLRAGAFAQFAFGRVFAIQPEVAYSRRGAQTQDEDSPVKLDLDYVEIPLLLMARLTSRESPVDPFLYTGPQVSFETRCRVSGEDLGALSGSDCGDFLPDGRLLTKDTEFGVVFGAGFDILFNRLTVQLDVRYNLGLTDLADDEAGDVSLKSRVWSFMLGFGIPLG